MPFEKWIFHESQLVRVVELFQRLIEEQRSLVSVALVSAAELCPETRCISRLNYNFISNNCITFHHVICFLFVGKIVDV